MWDSFSEVLEQPHFYEPLMAFWISLAVIYVLLSCLGFALPGVSPGFQSRYYGGFTPASGLFATLTSLGMRGLAQPVFAGIALLIAVVVAAVVTAIVR